MIGGGVGSLMLFSAGLLKLSSVDLVGRRGCVGGAVATATAVGIGMGSLPCGLRGSSSFIALNPVVTPIGDAPGEGDCPVWLATLM